MLCWSLVIVLQLVVVWENDVVIWCLLGSVVMLWGVSSGEELLGIVIFVKEFQDCVGYFVWVFQWQVVVGCQG